MKILRNLFAEISIINKTCPWKDYNFFHVWAKAIIKDKIQLLFSRVGSWVFGELKSYANLNSSLVEVEVGVEPGNITIYYSENIQIPHLQYHGTPPFSFITQNVIKQRFYCWFKNILIYEENN